MDSLADVLANRDFAEPEEMAAIRQFIYQKYGAEIVIGQQQRGLVIGVKSAALANKLRFDLPELQQLAKTDQRIHLQITD